MSQSTFRDWNAIEVRMLIPGLHRAYLASRSHVRIDMHIFACALNRSHSVSFMSVATVWPPVSTLQRGIVL